MPLVIFIFFLLLLIESTILSLPITLLYLLCLLVVRKNSLVLVIGFIAGLFLDMLLIRQFGITSMVIVTMLAITLLYQRKFEIASYYFIAIASFIMSLVYLFIFKTEHIFLLATISSILAILFFSILRSILGQKEKLHTI